MVFIKRSTRVSNPFSRTGHQSFVRNALTGDGVKLSKYVQNHFLLLRSILSLGSLTIFGLLLILRNSTPRDQALPENKDNLRRRENSKNWDLFKVHTHDINERSLGANSADGENVGKKDNHRIQKSPSVIASITIQSEYIKKEVLSDYNHFPAGSGAGSNASDSVTSNDSDTQRADGVSATPGKSKDAQLQTKTNEETIRNPNLASLQPVLAQTQNHFPPK